MKASPLRRARIRVEALPEEPKPVHGLPFGALPLNDPVHRSPYGKNRIRLMSQTIIRLRTTAPFLGSGAPAESPRTRVRRAQGTRSQGRGVVDPQHRGRQGSASPSALREPVTRFSSRRGLNAYRNRINPKTEKQHQSTGIAISSVLSCRTNRSESSVIVTRSPGVPNGSRWRR
jgi:hypothetical protein